MSEEIMIQGEDPKLVAEYQNKLATYNELQKIRTRQEIVRENAGLEIDRLVERVKKEYGIAFEDAPEYMIKNVPLNEEARRRFIEAVNNAEPAIQAMLQAQADIRKK